MSGHIACKAAGLNGTAPLGAALVMDIAALSQNDDVIMQVWGKHSTETPNQLWEFPADPSAPGYFHIKSALDGAHLGAPPGWPTLQYVVADRPSNVEDDRFRWRAVEDPNGSGFCYLQNKLLNLVIGTVAGSHGQGSKLTMVNPLLGHDSQMWQGAFPSKIAVPMETDYLNMGSGTGYYGSGGAKCTVAANLTMKSDGTCRYWGQYANCGDVAIFTAPPQDFGIAMVVRDLIGTWYSFTVGGFANDLQNLTWDNTGASSFVRENWISIALRGQCVISFSNDEANTGQSSDAANLNLKDIEANMQTAVTNGGGGSIYNSLLPNIIYQDIIRFPDFLDVASAGHPGGTTGFPVGWQPSGSGSEQVH